MVEKKINKIYLVDRERKLMKDDQDTLELRIWSLKSFINREKVRGSSCQEVGRLEDLDTEEEEMSGYYRDFFRDRESINKTYIQAILDIID